jgi:hypothetical protein
VAPSNNFRELLFPVDSPRLTAYRGMDARAYGKAILDFPPAAHFINWWKGLYAEPYRGISANGQIEPGLFKLRDEGAPVEDMANAAEALLQTLSEQQRSRVCHPIDAPEWRVWSNPEFLVNPYGLRLEDLSVPTREAVLALIKASLSKEGYEKARGCMQINAFLGALCGLPGVMNEWSYNFILFGQPSRTSPWGWNIYGHHLTLNCFILGRQMVISPTFMGAEPNVIDEGPRAGMRLFDTEERVGLALMRSLSPTLRERATTYQLMHDPKMPEGRWNPADQRHRGGAFQDNRIIPYEGIPVTEFSTAQRDQLMKIVAAFIGYLPKNPLAQRLSEVEATLNRTWWSWIGGHGDDDAFYYCIQSPVLMVEFDHHSGVWLNNQEPAKCHIHTVVRTPNGNDYGKDLLRQHYELAHPGRRPGQE